MDPYEPTSLLLSKIKSIDPENASKIMGYILIQDIGERDLLRLAFGPETLLQSVIIKVKTHLGLSSNTLSTPSTPSPPSPALNPIHRPAAGNCNPFSQVSPRVVSDGSFGRNPPPHAWPVSGLPGGGGGDNGNNHCISPKASPFLSYDKIRAGSVPLPPFSRNEGNGGGSSNHSGDFLDEYQLDDYFSFLDDSSSKNEEFLEPRAQLGGYSLTNGDAHLHRRRFSESDACFGAEEGGFGMGYKPCVYFARGFCKNGDNCKFVHGGFGGGDNIVEINGGGGAIVGSPREMEGLYLQQQEEMMRMKFQQQRLAYSKYMNFLLQQQNDPERLGAASALMSDELHNFSQFGAERSDFLAMGLADKPNSASRQIYLTFPADSTFKDEDVSNYFSTFGPVQDVRIPYQQNRMFGFVTFVHPETVKVILGRGNPHFICDSRVLVKPYKEKGKVANKRHLHLQQHLLERRSFSPGSSPSGVSPRELYDLHGARMLHNVQEIMLRRKFEEQAELQQAIELQGRRLINLQLPDLRGDFVRHHHRSLSVGSPFSFPDHTSIDRNVILSSDPKNQEAIEDNAENSVVTASFSTVFAEENSRHEVNAACVQDYDRGRDHKENYNLEECNDCESHGRNGDHVLPAILLASTKSSCNQRDISLESAAVNESTKLEDNVPVPATGSNMASP